jgi:hypothetical protein
VYLKTKILFFFLLIGLSVKGQSFLYSYVDPCTRQTKFITADMSAPVVISYYGQIKAFTYLELSNGFFESWLNDIYNKYKSTSPCQGVLTTTTTTTSTNQVSNIITNVTSLVSLDLSSVTSGVSGGVGNNVGGTTSSGSGSVQTKSNKNGSSPAKEQKTDGNSTDNPSGGDGATGSSGSSGSSSGNGEGSGQGSSETKQEGQVGNGSNSTSSSSSSGGGNGNSGAGGKGGTTSEKTETEKPNEQKVEEQKTETQKTQSNATAKAASKAKTETQKPAILITGDIVGIQTAADKAQDARATMSFTRVKGDGTASIGFSADYMMNAKIGNISGIKSWIGTNQKGNKHINIVSAGLGLMPQSTTGNALFVRVNSLRNFTALYGAAGTYGQLFGEELISTIAVLGCMYKGKLGKAVDATIIVAGIYSPYQKYYTESLFKNKPIVIPFLNLTYKMTKTFGIGLTGGGTYIAGQNVLNYQVLMGAKLKL